ncbi:hypothetical protein PR202_gb11961 [Eleusine coracana subsp. coracana]|uniref:SPARK domain-containing protein n=1 Tax=Eleusine coracana subsp. coracana TaxID=191504 RepID=A0AAV5ENH3_ELECO|nr:hypothetical protein PR202_gb11961 [Eleusine coracana subsp. coracana]
MAPTGRLLAVPVISLLFRQNPITSFSNVKTFQEKMRVIYANVQAQSSKRTGSLALDPTVANYCLSDVQELLLSQGASDNLHSLCSVHLSNVTEGSCPVSTVDAFENVIDSSKLLEACQKVDPVNECCSQTCQKAINEAAQKIATKDGGLTSYAGSPKIDSCRNVVLRWLSGRLDPPSAKQMLRQISNCNVNGVCPLSFPDKRSPMALFYAAGHLLRAINVLFNASFENSVNMYIEAVNIPERPAATSAQNGVNHNNLKLRLLISLGSLFLALLLQA